MVVSAPLPALYCKCERFAFTIASCPPASQIAPPAPASLKNNTVRRPWHGLLEAFHGAIRNHPAPPGRPPVGRLGRRLRAALPLPFPLPLPLPVPVDPGEQPDPAD